jgi:chemotaxis protein MotB
MVKKQKHHDEHIDETWLIPYADLLTLLLALFIVLFAMSEIDGHKLRKLANSFNIVFNGGTGVLEFDSPVPPKEQQPETSPENNQDRLEASDTKTDEERNEQENKKIEELKKLIDDYIKKNKLENDLSTGISTEGLKITIREKALFHSGSAEVLPEAKVLAKKISVLLEKAAPREINISGHTDNVPINNELFKSNWELSTTRAVNFMKVILENKRLDPSTFSATGYGEFRPVADNSTATGKAMNRRVEITIEWLIEK